MVLERTLSRLPVRRATRVSLQRQPIDKKTILLNRLKESARDKDLLSPGFNLHKEYLTTGELPKGKIAELGDYYKKRLYNISLDRPTKYDVELFLSATKFFTEIKDFTNASKIFENYNQYADALSSEFLLSVPSGMFEIYASISIIMNGDPILGKFLLRNYAEYYMRKSKNPNRILGRIAMLFEKFGLDFESYWSD